MNRETNRGMNSHGSVAEDVPKPVSRIWAKLHPIPWRSPSTTLGFLAVQTIFILLLVGSTGCDDLNNGDDFFPVTGTVVEKQTLEPIDSASVSIGPDLSRPVATSDSLGRFYVEILPTDRIVIYAGREGYTVDSIILTDVDRLVDTIVLRLESL
jgi:hypothetical protein